MPYKIFMSIITVLFLSFAAAMAEPSLAYDEVPVSATSNYAIHYAVHIDAKNPAGARVQMEARGANEILRMHFFLDKGRYKMFRGDGDIRPIGTDILWTPRKLNAKLSYEVSLKHERKPGIYDSYGEKDWFITRTTDLFPRKRIDFKGAAKSYTTMQFHLPPGWTVISEMEKIGKNLFRATNSDKTRYQWPTGWILFGKVGVKTLKAGDVTIRLAYPEDFLSYGRPKYPKKRKRRIARVERILGEAEGVFEKVVPLMKKFLPGYAHEFLVIFGKSPMWKGGISAEASLYVNRNTPVIASDYTSTLVHEYFHLSDGFKKDSRDGEWIVEGLAEYFSMRLLREADLISKEEFFRGVDSFRKNGIWNHSLVRGKNERVFYENAPLVLFTLDEMIREKYQGKRSLKDVMRRLDNEEDPLGTKSFREHAETVYDGTLKDFFKNHVEEGRLPPYKKYIKL